ncbi:MAG: hypothetical protein ABIJ50_03395 [Pseudomonadota bacterium]
MTELEPFLFENDLKKAIENGDQKHIFMAMRALARIGQPLSPELTLQLSSFCDPNRKPVKGGPKRGLCYNCDDDPSPMLWFAVWSDYDFLCRKENQELARFVVNCEEPFSVPIFAQDVSSWKLAIFRSKVFPQHVDIKVKLCQLYNISDGTFNKYTSKTSKGKWVEGFEDLVRTVARPEELRALEQISSEMVYFNEEQFQQTMRENRKKILSGEFWR